MSKLKLTTVDKYGEESIIYVDRILSTLVDEHDNPIIDWWTHPFRQKYHHVLELQVHSVKRFCDSFLMWPSPGLPTKWLSKRDEHPEAWEENIENFITAIYCLTGRTITRIEDA
jgi:hypothetical protein